MKFDISFKKSLGQNFIFDVGFLNGILDKLSLDKTHTVIEIGAGAGTLTKCLAARVGKVIAYEIDKSLEPILARQLDGVENVQVIFQDAMTVTDLPPDFLLVANIPYYITTPLVLKFLKEKGCREICVLVQDDVAKRIVAKPGTKDYGALSVTVQAQADCKIIKHAPRGLFRPVPKVDSAFVQIKKFPSLEGCPKGGVVFDVLVKGMFAARRKTVLNALKQICAKVSGDFLLDVLQKCNIDPTARPEQLGVDQFIKLSNELKGVRFEN